MIVNRGRPIENLNPVVKMPGNILSYNRFIYLTRYYILSDRLEDGVKNNEWIEIDTNGKPMSFNPGKMEIIISNYSVTKDKHPENKNDELIFQSVIYFGSILSDDPNIRYNGLKNIKNEDRVYIDDYFYNIIFDYYDPFVIKRALVENYARTDGIGCEARSLLNTEYKFIIPSPKYYTYKHQLFNEDNATSITDHMIDNLRHKNINQEYNAGKVKDLLDDHTKLIEFNVKLNEIASFIIQSTDKATFLETMMFLLSCLKIDMETCGFCTCTLILDSKTESFNIKELESYITLDKQRLKSSVALFAEYIDGRLKDIFLPLVCDIGFDTTLYVYMNKYQTSIHIECDRIQAKSTDYIQKTIVEGVLCSES